MINKVKLIAFLLLTTLSIGAQAQGVYKSKSSVIKFFSSTPVEDIEAISKSGGAAINFDNNKIFFKVSIKSFKFSNSLMQEHFNENYMESDKYPTAQYSGVLDQKIDPNKDGTYNTTTTGELTIHGVTRKYKVPVKLVVKNGKVTANANFNVGVADHKIKIPSIATKKIAKVIKVSVQAVFEK